MIWYEIGGNTHYVWSFIGFLTLETVLPSNIQVVLEVLELTCLGFGNRESGIHVYFCTSEHWLFPSTICDVSDIWSDGRTSSSTLNS